MNLNAIKEKFMPSKNPEVLKKAAKTYREKNKDNEEMKKAACVRAKEWAANNQEKLKAYRLANKDKAKIAKKEWNEKNREYVNKTNLEWQKNNPEYAKERNNRYKATENGKIVRRASRDAYRKRCTDASMNKYDMKKVYGIYKQCKQLCVATGQEYHVDHIVPIRHPRVCGLHVSWNLQVIAKKDNLSKNNHFDG
jgi:hypothetical protein